VEVKSDKDAEAEDVAAKREAARRWVNHVNADKAVPARWGYLFVTESDIKAAKDSWPVLRKMGTS